MWKKFSTASKKASLTGCRYAPTSSLLFTDTHTRTDTMAVSHTAAQGVAVPEEGMILEVAANELVENETKQPNNTSATSVRTFFSLPSDLAANFVCKKQNPSHVSAIDGPARLQASGVPESLFRSSKLPLWWRRQRSRKHALTRSRSRSRPSEPDDVLVLCWLLYGALRRPATKPDAKWTIKRLSGTLISGLRFDRLMVCKVLGASIPHERQRVFDGPCWLPQISLSHERDESGPVKAKPNVLKLTAPRSAKTLARLWKENNSLAFLARNLPASGRVPPVAFCTGSTELKHN